MAHDDDRDLTPADPAATDLAVDIGSSPKAPKPSLRTPRVAAWGLALLIALATLATFRGALDAGFSDFDDPQYVVHNPQVLGGLSVDGIRWAFTRAHSDNWHPLTWMSHMLDVSLFGLDPRGHHATSLALHALNAALLFAWLLRVSRRAGWSLLVAALFALHPLRVESVAWIAERKDVLSGCFFLLTLLAYTHYAVSPTRRAYGLVLLSFGLGLLAKPMLVSLPLLLLLLDRWPLERTRSFPPEWELWKEKLPLFALSLASALVTLWAQSIGGTVKSLEFISLPDRVWNAALSVWTYLGQFVWPERLAFFYPHPALVDAGSGLGLAARGAIALLALVAVTLLALRSAERAPWWIVGWGWMLVSLAPVIGIIQVGAQAHADRYTYLPLIGPVVALMYGADRALAARAESRGRAAVRVWRGCTAAALTLACAALALRSAEQVRVWQTSERLYLHALDVTEQNYIAAFNLGALASGAGDEARAIGFYELALGMRADYAPAHSNLGVAYDRLGETARAEHHYLEALALDPRLTQAALNLGGLYLAREQWAQARAHFERARAARPDLARPHEALGELHAMQGDPAEALEHFAAAVERSPGSAVLHARLASGYEALRREREAIGAYRDALAWDPALLVAQNGLANLLATAENESLREPARAIELARRANEATGYRNPTFLMTLALAHAAADEHQEAGRQRDRALGFAKPHEREALRRRFELGARAGAAQGSADA